MKRKLTQLEKLFPGRRKHTPAGFTKSLLLCAAMLCGIQVNAQTYGIDPTDDGGFENSGGLTGNGWTGVSGGTNSWYSGSAVQSAGSNGAFISNNGSSWSYTNFISTITHFYKDIAIPSNATNIVFGYKWKGYQEPNYDWMNTYIGTSTTTVNSGGYPTGGGVQQMGNQHWGQSNWQTATYPLSNSLAGTTIRVIFTWRCDGSVGSEPGAIDEVYVSYDAPCTGQPVGGQAVSSASYFKCSGTPTLNLTGATSGTNMAYQWQRRPEGNGPWTNIGSTQSTIPLTLTAPITSSTEFRCWAKCVTANLTDTSLPVLVTVDSTTVTPDNIYAICTPPSTQTMTVTAPALPDTLFNENFNGTTHSMVMNNNYSSNGNAFFQTVGSSFYDGVYSGLTFSNTSKFMFTNTYSTSSTSTSDARTTTLNTVGYTSLSLSFRHSVYYGSSSYPGVVQVSTNGGSSWSTVGSYGGTTVCCNNNFASVTINLNSYINQASVIIRWYASFPANSYYGFNWAVDDILVTGAHPALTYAWSATPSTGAGLPAGAGTPSLTNTSIVINPNPGSYVYTATVTGQAGGCASTKSVTVNVGPKPSSTLSGDNVICNGDQTPLTVNFLTGTPPYQVIYSDGTNQDTVNNITTSSVTIPVTPGDSVIYTIVGLATPVCTAGTAQMTGTATVHVNQRPTSVLASSSQTICDASTAYLPVTFTGTPPFDITYSDGSTTYTVNGINTQNYQLPVVVQSGVHTYTITGITDANGCMSQPGDMTGSATITSQIRPTGTISGNPTLCNGSLATVQVSFTGTPPYSFGYTDGGSFIYSVNNITSNPYTLVLAPSSTSTYTLDHVTDANCTTISQDLSGSSYVTVNQRPTSVLSGVGQTICDGNQVNLSVSFTGIPPYSFGYSNGNSSSVVSGIYSSTYNFTVTPTLSGTYIVTGVNDLFCAAQLPDMTGAVPVTVRDPEATLSGTQVTCAGDTVAMLIDFGGAGATPPYSVLYSNGTQNQLITTSSDPYVLNVPAINTANFTLLSMTDANCPGDVMGSAMLTVEQPGGWKGMISSDWQNPSNWCGVLPTSTTDVHIPAAAPNQPVLSYGAGYCDTMDVEAGASVTVSAGANLNLYGDLNNSGILNWTYGNINMNGSVPQYVSGFLTQNLYINNNAGVVPTSEVEVMALMIMNGNVYLNNADLTMKSGALIIGDDYFKYVHTQGNGTLNMDVTSGGTRFPVGNSTYNPVRLTNNGIPDRFSVRVIDAVYADGYGTNPSTVTFPVVNRTWMISEDVAGGSLVTIQPQWNGMTAEEINFFDRGHSFIRHWDGTSWSYQDSANAGPAIGTDPYYISEGVYSSFSPFTVGGHNMWPLAIELLDFTAQLQDNNSALLNWQVSQSSDAGMFEIEHGTDGENFTRIGELAAVAGKTGYSNIHRGLAEGRNYYRLRVTDNAGKSGYSKIAVVSTTAAAGVEVISLSPNPVTGIGVVSISSAESTQAEIRILDAVGRVLYKGSHELTKGTGSISLDMNQLAQGNYTLHVITEAGNATPVKFSKL